MAAVTIRNLDDAVVDRLRKRAKLNNRSLEAELRRVLNLAAGEAPALDRAAVAERIRAMSLHPFPERHAALVQEAGSP